jgi:hypothetical protein
MTKNTASELSKCCTPSGTNIHEITGEISLKVDG